MRMLGNAGTWRGDAFSTLGRVARPNASISRWGGVARTHRASSLRLLCVAPKRAEAAVWNSPEGNCGDGSRASPLPASDPMQSYKPWLSMSAARRNQGYWGEPSLNVCFKLQCSLWYPGSAVYQISLMLLSNIIKDVPAPLRSDQRRIFGRNIVRRILRSFFQTLLLQRDPRTGPRPLSID